MTRAILILSSLLCLMTTFARAQDLTVATVTRPPFSLMEDGAETGFALDLWAALLREEGRTFEVRRMDSFRDMLDLVRNGEVDAAAANISITATREAEMDFTHPIYSGGLQIMIPYGSTQPSIWSVILSRDLMLAVLAAFALLFGTGMLMWRFERDNHPYFEGSARQAAFPAFWWALNLVVNGGFEERMPRSPMGRAFGVLLVVSSLFIVSIFVAQITAALTVGAIQNSINAVSDLDGKRVGTISDSTAANYLEDIDLRYVGFQDFISVTAAFEAGELDAVVFDAPILAYYINTTGSGIGQLTGRVFKPENYAIALPTGSPLGETLNRSLLRLREDGTYDVLHRKWFGISSD